MISGVPECAHCGYDMTPFASEACEAVMCPECGHSGVPRRASDPSARRPRNDLLGLSVVSLVLLIIGAGLLRTGLSADLGSVAGSFGGMIVAGLGVMALALWWIPAIAGPVIWFVEVSRVPAQRRYWPRRLLMAILAGIVNFGFAAVVAVGLLWGR